MGSSGTGIGETLKKKAGITGRTLAAAAAAPFTGGASLATDVALSQMERKKKQAKERAQASQTRLQQEAEAAQKLQEEREKKEIAQESVRKQKAKARQRTIFAGRLLEENIFRRTLGG
jgi:ribulose kinase